MSQPTLGSKPASYMPQLDALRTFAVVAVWFAHWGIAGLPGFRLLPWGNLGVQLFFVLSGFLISGILLNLKNSVEAGDESFGFAVRRFYIRRSLRIFPIYYLVLFATTAVIAHMREPFFWHLTYSNIYFARRGDLSITGSHLWTLSVEEQFYLLWPWVILFTPRRHLLKMMGAVLLAGPALRLGLRWAFGPAAAGVLMFANMDAFAMGGMLALLGGSSHSQTPRRRLCQLGLLIGLPLLVALSLLPPESSCALPYRTALLPLACAGVFTWLIGGASTGFGGFAGRMLQWPPLIYLGKISYGLYLYHPFVGWLFDHGTTHLGLRLPKTVWFTVVQFFLLALLTIALSALSWRFFEKPINNLKRHFEYTPPAPAPAQVLAN